MPERRGLAGSRSDAESVTIATRLKGGPPPGRPDVAGMIRAGPSRRRVRAGVQPLTATLPAMDRSLWAVLAGTFTLRFSTGLTGAMLAFYLAQLPEHGGPEVAPRSSSACFAATFYLAELVLSPFFGILSDRLGHHRVMLFGPVFGAVAVILTGAHDQPASILGGDAPARGRLDGRERPVDPRLHRRSPPPATSCLRGKAAARFEGATLAGHRRRASPWRRCCSRSSGPTRSSSTPAFYGVSFLIYQFGVADPAGEGRRERRRTSTSDFRRYLELLRTSHVWLLAPTWIAVNASIGLWFSQSLFQFAKADPRFPDQALMRGFRPSRSRRRRSSSAIVFGAGLSTGATASGDCAGPRSSSTGSSAAAPWSRRPRRQPRRRHCPLVARRSPARRSRRSGCSCSPARRPRRSGCSPTSRSASRTTAARSWACTRVFLAVGQIIGALHRRAGGRLARHRRHAHRARSACCSIAAGPARRGCGATRTSSAAPAPTEPA